MATADAIRKKPHTEEVPWMPERFSIAKGILQKSGTAATEKIERSFGLSVEVVEPRHQWNPPTTT